MVKKVKIVETLCKDGYDKSYAKNKNYEFKRDNQVVSLLSKGKELCRFVITGYEQGKVEKVTITNRFEANAVTTFVQYFGLDSIYEWDKNTYTVK